MKRFQVLIGLVAVMAVRDVAAQDALWALSNSQEGAFGRTMSGLADVDGDAVPDLAIGAPVSGKVKVHSGADGALLYTISRDPESLFGETITALGDFDGDGVGEFAVGAPFESPGVHQHAGRVQILSGVDGSVLFSAVGSEPEARLGLNLAVLGDASLDGFLDLAYSYREGDYRRVRVTSGPTFHTIADIGGFAPDDGFGTALAGGGDIDGDGCGDLVVGAPDALPGASVTAYSGATMIPNFPPQILYHRVLLGQHTLRMALPGDWDGDERSELVVFGGSPTKIVHSDGSISEVASHPAGAVTGVKALGDVDGDGRGDLAMSMFNVNTAPVDANASNGVHVVSGPELHPLYSALGSGVASCAAVGDLDEDGVDDLLAAFVSLLSSEVRLVPGRQGPITPVGEACTPGSADELTLEIFGTASPGGRLAVGVESLASPSEPVVLLLGLPSAPIGLPSGCSVHVAPVIAQVPLALNAFQDAAAVFELPQSAAGITIGFQVIRQKASGQLGFSRAFIVRIVN
jgi:hypothetical protein